MSKGKAKVIEELQNFSRDQLDKAVMGKSKEEVVAALENYTKSIVEASKDKDIYPMPALEMYKTAIGAAANIGGIREVVSPSEHSLNDAEMNKIGTAAYFLGGAIGPALLTAVTLGATWGAARISYEAAKQFNSYGDANIGGNLTTSINDLKSLEEKSFSKDNPAFAILKELEKEVIAEGNKMAPELNTMREALTKTQLLREAILETSDLPPKTKEEIYKQSAMVTDNFKSWGKIQQGRHNPILAIVSDVANYMRPEVKVMEKPGGMAERVSNSRNSSSASRARQ